MLQDELWRRQDSQGRRLTTIESVASVLLGGAALTSTIIATLERNLLLDVALICGLTAAMFGLFALVPRKIVEIAPRHMRGQLRKTDAARARVWYTDRLIGQIERREKLIGHRFSLVRVGLVFLSITVLCVALAVAIHR